jgi:FolB domain-containing protein
VSSEDRIIVKNLLLRGIVGLNDWERKKKQDIRINMTVYSDVRAAGASDEVGDTLNYRTLTKRAIEYVEGSEHYLVEALATGLARIAVVDMGAERIRVRVEKPGALRFAESVGVEIERAAADFDG